MFVRVVCVLVGFLICFFQNLFVNNDCVFFFLILMVMKRIEAAKNRVKTEFEASVQNVDVKQQD